MSNVNETLTLAWAPSWSESYGLDGNVAGRQYNALVGELDVFKRGEVKAPTRGSSRSAGLDVYNNLNYPVRLGCLERRVFPTGLCFDIPEGYELQVRPRSGNAATLGLSIVNAPGTVDADYTGEVGVILINQSYSVVQIDPGMKIAQLVLAPVPAYDLVAIDVIDKDTERGADGFGSTGV